MNWSIYHYLAGVAVAALALAVLIIRVYPRLTIRSRRRTPVELVVLVLTSVLGLVLIYYNFYIERLYFALAIGDVGCDTIEQYVPFYCSLISRVREGALSFWSFDYELGTSLAGTQTWTFDPFNLLLVPIVLVLGDAHLSFALVVTQSAKVLCSIVLFDHLLTRFCEIPLTRILGALLAGFSGFPIMYGQHYWFGTAFPFCIAIILLFELYLEKSSPLHFLLLTLGIATLFGWSLYVAYLIMLFAAIYLLFRIPAHLQKPSIGAYLVSIAKLFVPVICGGLVSAVLCFPYALFLTSETSRTSSDLSITQRLIERAQMFVPRDWIPAILSRILGTGLINTGRDETYLISGLPDISFEGSFPYEFIMVGISGAGFVLLSQYFAWVHRHCTIPEKILVVLGSLMVGLYCFHQLLPTIFTGMVRLQYRSSFTLIIPLVIAMSIGFEECVLSGKVAKGPLVVSALLTMAVLGWSLFKTINGRIVCLFYIVATIVVIVLGWRCTSGSAPSALVATALVAAIVSMSIVDGFFDTNARLLVIPNNFPHSATTDQGVYTTQALDYLKEKDPTFYRTERTYSTWSPLNDAMIYGYYSASAYNSTPDADVDEFYHKLWKESISTWAVYSQGYKNAKNNPEIMQLLGIRYVLTTQKLKWTWAELEKQIGSVYIYRNKTDQGIASLRTKLTSESEADALPDAASRRALLASSIIVPDEVSDHAMSGGELKNVSSEFSQDGGSKLVGHINCDQDAAVCLAIPHTGTWTIKVDGKKVETFRANYGFYGFFLPAGNHDVTATYLPDGLMIGAVVSVVGVVLTIATMLFLRRTHDSSEVQVAA